MIYKWYKSKRQIWKKKIDFWIDVFRHVCKHLQTIPART